MTDAMPTVVGKPCDNDICSADIYCRKMSTIVIGCKYIDNSS